MKIHEKYISRCIDIAKNGLGTVAPNPMVGCVIVHNDIIIGEGFTSPYGGSHAEVNAINSVVNKNLLQHATLYVTLEPCSHYGKTPPCTDFILENKIPQVVIGTVDTHSMVAGKGIERLKNAGCQVIVGILEEGCKEHHKRFFTFHDKKRPYIILKWAESKDGFLAPETKTENKPVWITNRASRQLVHKWRTQEQAILIGTTTAIADNPHLTARNWKGTNPIRVIIDRSHKLKKELNIFNKEARTIVISENDIVFNKDFALNLCSYLHSLNILSIIIEGGAQTLQSFLELNLWDEARVFTGTLSFYNGTKAPVLDIKALNTQVILEDTLRVYRND